MNTITEILGKIDGYSKEHHGLHLFNRVATEEEIAEAERQIGISFPESLKELYRFSNGMRPEYFGSPLFGLQFPNLEDLVREYRGWECFDDEEYSDLYPKNYAADQIREGYFNRGWVPFLFDGAVMA